MPITTLDEGTFSQCDVTSIYANITPKQFKEHLQYADPLIWASLSRMPGWEYCICGDRHNSARQLSMGRAISKLRTMGMTHLIRLRSGEYVLWQDETTFNTEIGQALEHLNEVLSRWQNPRISGKMYVTENSGREEVLNARIPYDGDVIADHAQYLDTTPGQLQFKERYPALAGYFDY